MNKIFTMSSVFQDFQNETKKTPIKKQYQHHSLKKAGVVLATTVIGGGINGYPYGKQTYDTFEAKEFKKIANKLAEEAGNNWENMKEVLAGYGNPNDEPMQSYFDYMKSTKKDLIKDHKIPNPKPWVKERILETEQDVATFNKRRSDIFKTFVKKVMPTKEFITKLKEPVLKGSAIGFASGLALLGIAHLFNKTKKDV